MKYIIDYRCGGMGNSVLAHVLYSCNQVDIDFDNFFSDTGNSHKIVEFNRSNLIARHEEQDPYPEPKTVLVSILCKDWYEILRKKFAYTKWKQYCPTASNYVTDFKFDAPIDGQSDLENLSTKYYVGFDTNVALNKNAHLTLLLEDYVVGNLAELESTVIEHIGWSWNRDKSLFFHDMMLEKNKLYFDWLYKIQSIVESCKDCQNISIDLEFWEKAVVIAKVCYDLGINPIDLHWNDSDCFLEKNNVSLVNSIKRLKHGKTI